MSDSSYPTIIIPLETLDDITEFFDKKGWTWYNNIPPYPKLIEEAIKEKTNALLQEDLEQPDWVSGGRLCLVPHEYVEGVPKQIHICIEVGVFDVTYDSSPTKEKED